MVAISSGSVSIEEEKRLAVINKNKSLKTISKLIKTSNVKHIKTNKQEKSEKTTNRKTTTNLSENGRAILRIQVNKARGSPYNCTAPRRESDRAPCQC